MKKLCLIMIVALLTQIGSADIIQHLTFDVDGTAAVGFNSTFGEAASVDTVDKVAGAGSLVLDPALITAPESVTGGYDGAITDGDLNWDASDIRTVSFWMKAVAGDTGDTWPTMISPGSTTTGAATRFDIRLENDNLRLETSGGGSNSGFNVVDGTWKHIVVVCPIDGATIADVKYYVNGVYEGNFDHTQQINTTPGPLKVGDSHNDAGRDFKGHLDDVQIYDHALTDAEILSLYNNPGSIFANAAYGPMPANGAENVAVDTQLSWNAPTTYTGATYAIYFGTDPNFNNPAPYGLTQLDNGADTSATTIDPGTLTNEEPYHWFVDSYEPNTVGTQVPTLHPGSPWSFTTIAEEPTIEVQPISTTIQPGQTSAVLTIKALNAELYEWYQVGVTGAIYPDGTLGTPLASSTYTVSAEGEYYCVVSNSDSAVSATSNTVRVMTPRLVAHWDFNNNLVDTEGGYEGTYIDPNDGTADTVSFTAVDDAANLDGQAFNFDGGRWDLSHIQIDGDPNDFNFYAAGFTTSAWIKTTQTGYGAYISKQALDGASGFLVTHNGGTAIVAIRGQNGASASAAVNDDQWHMVTGVYDPNAAEIRLFVDGVQIAANPLTGVPATTDQPLIFGAELTDGSIGYRGLLDEVRIWNYPRTPEAIAWDYNDFRLAGTIAPCLDSTGLELDMNDDCFVNLEDFAEFALVWLNCREASENCIGDPR